MTALPLPGYICPACHTGECKPVVRVALEDGDGVWVHRDCQAEIEQLKRNANNRRLPAWHN